MWITGRREEVTTEEAKLKNIIEMAVGFTVMKRVFEKRATTTIKDKLYEILQDLEKIETIDDFDKMHDSFCRWFVLNIKLAKSDGFASYGHSAKVLDISLKVFVYYCGLPDYENRALGSGLEILVFSLGFPT